MDLSDRERSEFERKIECLREHNMFVHIDPNRIKHDSFRHMSPEERFQEYCMDYMENEQKRQIRDIKLAIAAHREEAARMIAAQREEASRVISVQRDKVARMVKSAEERLMQEELSHERKVFRSVTRNKFIEEVKRYNQVVTIEIAGPLEDKESTSTGKGENLPEPSGDAILEKTLTALKEKELDMTDTTTVAVHDDVQVAQHLALIGSKTGTAAERIKKLQKVIDEIDAVDVTPHNVVAVATDYVGIEENFTSVAKEIAPLATQFDVMKAEKKSLANLNRKWVNRVNKAEKYMHEAREKGYPKKAAEFEKLLKIAQQTGENVSSKLNTVEGNIDAVHMVLHEMNMTQARLLSAMVNCNTMISEAPAVETLDKARARLSGALKSIESYEKMVKSRPKVKSITA